jgi:hypothetical protein
LAGSGQFSPGCTHVVWAHGVVLRDGWSRLR